MGRGGGGGEALECHNTVLQFKRVKSAAHKATLYDFLLLEGKILGNLLLC